MHVKMNINKVTKWEREWGSLIARQETEEVNDWYVYVYNYVDSLDVETFNGCLWITEFTESNFLLNMIKLLMR